MTNLPEYGQNIVRLARILGVTSVLLTDADGNPLIVATDAPHPNLGVPTMGRFGTADLNVDEGDAVPIRTNDDGEIIISSAITGLNNVQDDSGNTDTQTKGTDQGVLYSKLLGGTSISEEPELVDLEVTLSAPTALSARDYMAENIILVPDRLNTDAESLFGDSQNQRSSIEKGKPLVLIVPQRTDRLFVDAHTTGTDKMGALVTLRDRADFRQRVLELIVDENRGGFYLPFSERTGSIVSSIGENAPGDSTRFSLTGATLGQAGIFGLGTDLDGVNDFYIQETVDSEQGVVSGAEANGSADIDDTLQDFTDYNTSIPKYYLVATDASSNKLSGFLSGDPDGDGTKVNIFSDFARTIQNWIQGSGTAFSFADTPITYRIYVAPFDPTGAFTWFCWVKADITLSGDDHLFSRDSGAAPNRQYSTFWNSTSGAFTFGVSDDGASSDFVSTLWRRTDAWEDWHFLCGRFVPSTTVDLFFDAFKRTTVTTHASMQPSTEPITIGASRIVESGGTAFFGGQISHFGAIGAALNDNEIRSLYEMSRR